MTVRASLLALVTALLVFVATAALAPAATTTKLDAYPFQFARIACPSSTQCTGVEDDAGNDPATVSDREVTFNPYSPGGARPVPIFNDGVGVGSISCPTTTQCTAIDGGLVPGSGEEVTFDPKAPDIMTSAFVATPSDGPIHTISCPSTTQCTADFKDARVLTFNPLAPGGTSAVQLDHNDVFYGLACPSTTQCTVVTEAGGELTFNPQTDANQGPVEIREGYVLAFLACPSATQCTATDDDGYAVTFNPQAPVSPLLVTVASGALPGFVSSIACPSTSQCTAIETFPLNTDPYTFNPTSHARASSSLKMGDAELDCGSTTACVAVGAGPYVEAFNPRSMAQPFGVSVWSTAKCKSTYKTWQHGHRHASSAQRRAEAKSLEQQHGCPASSV